MTTVPTQQVTLPSDLVAELTAAAKAMGLDLAAYLVFLRRSHERRHDAKFRDAAKYVFSKYPNTLRKLAQ